MLEAFPITFDPGRAARAVVVRAVGDLPAALAALGLPAGRPAVVVVGGAAGLAAADRAPIRRLCAEAILPAAAAAGAAIVDGGTNAGVMQLVGQAHAAVPGAPPLVGVAALGAIGAPDGAAGSVAAVRARLEPHHTHFVLVPGAAWGDESPWLAAVAGTLAGTAPSLTILMNGGAIARADVRHSVEAGRPVAILQGSGRMADELAGEIRADGAAGPPASRLLTVFDMAGDPADLRRIIMSALTGRT